MAGLLGLLWNILMLVRYTYAVPLESVPETALSQIQFYCIHPSSQKYIKMNFKDKHFTEKLDLKLKFAFYIHGWLSEFNIEKSDSLPYKIGMEWIKAEKTNFCGVNWKELANDAYTEASFKNIKFVATELALFIKCLLENKIKSESITLAGHSLGAHTAGLAGKFVHEMLGLRVARIFGLDPAGPFFTSLIVHTHSCLNKTNANFVQVLHTSMGTYGTSEQTGHADFYANGGRIQKKCVDLLLEAEDLLFKCSHSHAVEIFHSSFTNTFTGFRVNSTGIISSVKKLFRKKKGQKKHNAQDTDVFGIRNKGLHGKFNLPTTGSPPYCVH